MTGIDVAAASERWEQLESLLHAALEKEPSARAEFLAAECHDAAIREEIHGLLQAHDTSGALDSLSDKVMQPLLAAARVSRPVETPHVIGATPELERYRIIERLGGGGMGVVYRARDERLDRDVALKFLLPHLSADEASKKRFLVEARAAASLEHPNICTVHEIGETRDGQLYIVMGYYDGVTLDRRIAGGSLPLDEAIRIAIQVARGLTKAHDRKIVHRDIKPANIMLTSDGLVKILDFGIAKLSDLTAASQTVGVMGTLAYMSPEQAFGEAVDARTDIWALGVVLYEMLSGKRPFRGPGEQAVLYAILAGQHEPIAEVAGHHTPAIEAIIRSALAKKPDDRFVSTHELLSALGELEVAIRTGTEPAAWVARAAVAPQGQSSAPRSESQLTLAGERRHAAVVVTGVADYATLIERLAPDELDRVLNDIRTIATEVATRHGGIVNHFAGDEAVMLFGVVTSHEDDSLRAVRAAFELHARVRALAPMGTNTTRVRMRSGVHSGVHSGALVVQRLRRGDRRFRLSGTPLDVATRLAALASGDALLLSPDAHRLVAPFVETEPSVRLVLQDEAAPVTTFRVIGESNVHSRLEIAERTGLTPLAGRSREVQVLDELLAAAVNGDGCLAVLIGDPGAGKSRLLLELRRHVEKTGAQLSTGRCDAHDGTTPYSPLAQAIRELLLLGAARDVNAGALADAVRAVDPSLVESLPYYCALLAVESAAYALPKHMQGEHLQAAMLEALAALITVRAAQRPVVLLLEDWHWADEGSRRALEQLVEIAPAHRLMIVVTCRPDSGVHWNAADRSTLLHLRPLSLEDSTEIIRGVLGAERVAVELAQQLHERTGGNPFFLEETCTALLEQRLVIVRDGEAVADEATALMELPETVQAVIRTRLDRLMPETRDTLRVASVIGRDFTRAVLDELVESPTEVGEHLNELRRTGLVQQTSVAPEPAYRFKHVLTQEVAYDTLLEHQRETLHGKGAAAIERRYADHLDEYRERLAYHFSRAGQWLNAALHGIQSADRSQALSQFADALAMLDRVRVWVDRIDDETRRRELLSDVYLRQERLCETIGLRARQITLAEDLIALLASHGGSSRLAEAYLRQGDVFTLLARFDSADRSLSTSLRLSRERGDRAGERNALRSFGLLRSHEGRYVEAVRAIEDALALDSELGEPGAAAGDVASLGNVLRKMGRPHDAIEALEKARVHLTREKDPTKWCSVLTVIAAAHRDLGDDVAALGYLVQVRDAAIEQRLPVMASFCLPAIAAIHLHQGNVEKGLATYVQAVELSRRAHHAEGLAHSQRALGEVLYGLGRFKEAVPHLREAADLFVQLGDRDTESHLWVRLATALEQCGRAGDAQQFWEQVQARCEESGELQGDALALEGIARCSRLLGVRDAALRAYERALSRVVATGHRERESALRNTLGLLSWEDGAYAEAQRHYEGALRLCRERSDRAHEGLILNSLGATLLKLGRYDEAQTALEEAATVNASTGERQLEAHSYAVLGDCLLETRRNAEARTAFERSLALRPMLADRRGEGWMLERIGRALLGEGRAGEAREVLERARVIAAEIADAGLTAAVERRLASL